MVDVAALPLADPQPGSVDELLAETRWGAQMAATSAQRARMGVGRVRLEQLADRQPIYGVSRGFGPLVTYPADGDLSRQGAGLVRHLGVGQGRPLPPEVTRTMIWLRLQGMKGGYSAVALSVWEALAAQWNAGFTPVVPQDGSLSASGDLVPLAHAALAAGGEHDAWHLHGTGWVKEPAAVSLHRLGLRPVRWEARSALAFVNGTSASLARALHNHARLATLVRAGAAATGRLAALLGASPEAYADEVARVRNQPGQRRVAGWIRAELGPGARRAPDRPLQEPYSLRCAPQVLGAVFDQLTYQERVLLAESAGCTDNPVLVDGHVFHGGNFHAAPVALACDQHASCTHQVAFLAERQLALAVDPRHNGGLPPLLSPHPGPSSGLAGVQIAASSHLAGIRQLGYPASMTALPTNLGNQDHVPMALNGANAVADMLDRAWWVMASLILAVHQLRRFIPASASEGLWRGLEEAVPLVEDDRPLAADVQRIAALAEAFFGPEQSTCQEDM